MSITSEIIRGHTDAIILSKLAKKDNYGYAINKAIKIDTNNMYELNEATLYTSFRRLEASGCIISYWGNEPNNARRKYYHITDRGRTLLCKMTDEWNTAKNMIDQMLNTEE